MKEIVHIVNPNGLGHLRRSIFIWNNVNISNVRVKLLIDHSQSKYLSFFNPKPFISFENMDFKGMISLSNIKNKDFILHYFKLQEKFNNSTNYEEIDLVISDNTLLDFSSFCDNYLVFGSFFWHDIVKNNSSLEEVILNEKKIIELNAPRIYGIDNFISGSLKEYDFVGNIGWLVNQKKRSKCRRRNLGVLFSGGLGEIEISMVDAIIDVLSKSSIEFDVFSSHKYNFITNSISFDFDKGWDKIDFVISRPGIGSISDCIENNLPIVAIGEITNSEMVFNARAISDLNIGFDYVNKKFDLDFLDKLEVINTDKLSLKGLNDVSNIIKRAINYD